MKALRAYAELIRLPNVFTALADILAGYWAMHGTMNWSGSLCGLLGSSACLYSAGIVLNDLHDIDTDRNERPSRPLPSGRISVQQARRLALILGILGVAFAALAGRDEPTAHGPMNLLNHSSIIASFLLIAIVCYDYVFKQTFIAPLLMGACRGLNLLLGMSPILFSLNSTESKPFAIIVGAFTLYIAAVTYFGRDEAGTVHRRRLVIGTVGILLAIFVMGTTTTVASGLEGFSLVLWLALMIHLARMCLRAIRNPDPRQVQFAMKTFILSIIAFDATIGAAIAGWTAGVVILLLLVPTIAIGRWIYST